MEESTRYSPGQVRDAVKHVLNLSSRALSVKEIEKRVTQVLGPTPTSSVRSYLRLNTPDLFVREDRGLYSVRKRAASVGQRDLAHLQEWRSPVRIGCATLFHADCFDWIEEQSDKSIQAVVTDPPYGLQQYSTSQQSKLRFRK